MTEQKQVQVTQEWETFCDRSYYDMWCVRRVGERTFGQGFHVMSQGEAEALRDLLNARHTATADALEAMREAREALAKHGRHRPECRMYAYNDCTCGLTDNLTRLTAAIAKIEGEQP